VIPGRRATVSGMTKLTEAEKVTLRETRAKREAERAARADFYAAKEVARVLGRSTDSVYRLARKRGLPAIRIGRTWRFPKGPIDRLAETGLADQP
jgi:excisionase family DNA binding protein